VSTSPLTRYRKEARVTVAECAAACGMSASSYRRLESGTLAAGGRDPVALRLPLARLFAARLGRPVSAQWDLSGDGRPPTPSGSPDARAPLRLAIGGAARPCTVGASVGASATGRRTVPARDPPHARHDAQATPDAPVWIISRGV